MKIYNRYYGYKPIQIIVDQYDGESEHISIECNEQLRKIVNYNKYKCDVIIFYNGNISNSYLKNERQFRTFSHNQINNKSEEFDYKTTYIVGREYINNVLIFLDYNYIISEKCISLLEEAFSQTTADYVCLIPISNCITSEKLKTTNMEWSFARYTSQFAVKSDVFRLRTGLQMFLKMFQ